MATELYGYRYSVYSWIARLALQEKGVSYGWQEIDPFAEAVPADYLAMHPFKRVPVLVHDGFTVYETGAITRYVDDAFAGPRLQPDRPEARARCNQILSIADGYAYWPLVRQVFAHLVFRPLMRQPADEAQVRRGLAAAPTVLAALEALAQGGGHLVGDGLSLADIHLAPMVGYFALAPEGRALLDRHDRLCAWWSAMSQRPALQASTPRLPDP